MSWIVDFFQNYRIDKLNAEAGIASSLAGENRHNLKALEERLDNLALITQAMWELLEQAGHSRTDLARKVEEIDLRDGRRDGKVSEAMLCGDCGHKLGGRHNHCFYCGAEVKRHIFRSFPGRAER